LNHAVMNSRTLNGLNATPGKSAHRERSEFEA
jgi:hypothetical protein